MRTYLKLVGSVALWGGTWISGRLLTQDLPPFPAAFLRFLVAGALLVLLSCRMEHRFPRLRRDQVLPAAFLGLTGIFLYNFFFFSGLKTTTAGRAALIVATIPSFISLFSALLFRERFTPFKAGGVVLSLCGVLVVISGGNPLVLLREGVRTGDLYILGCVFSWAAYSLGGKAAMGRFSPLSAVTWSCLLGALFLFPAALATGLIPLLPTAGLLTWGNIFYLGIFGTVVAFLWYYEGILAIGPSRAGVFINLVPVFAIVLGALLLGEHPTLSLLSGGALVVTGVFLTNRG